MEGNAANRCAHRPRARRDKEPKQQERKARNTSTNKKRKHPDAAAAAATAGAPSAPAAELVPRHYTVSIAVAGSIVLNAQSPELRTYLIGEIARAAAIFQVDEIVVFADASGAGASYNWGDPNLFFGRLLQYIETPQYLRKAIFPHHSDLRFAGLLNPLDAPHHPRAHEQMVYREGVTVDTPASISGGSLVNVGLRNYIHLDRRLKPGVRVTVKMTSAASSSGSSRKHQASPQQEMEGVAVSPEAPRETHGLYWGYTTRLAKSLTEVFAGSPYKEGYDLTVGTSERGHQSIDDEDFALPAFRHLLVVFGGVAGLEACVEAAEDLDLPAGKTHTLFDKWLNVCPDQGSRTIRTEEAVPITMARLRPFIVKSGRREK
ncbi:nucleic acid-ob-fold-like protein [Nannochloropsis oceanica]